jgi:polyisoprenoid-binding protein YceI
MKLNLWIATLLAVPAFAATTYKVDPNESKLNWEAKKVTGSHNGVLTMKSGKLDFDGDKLKGGEFVVDMTSLKVLDVTDPKYNSDLTNHLKSDDFFSTEKSPESKFTLKSVTKKADGTWEAEGPMTIKGISHDIKVPLTVEKTNDHVVVKGKASLDRTKWNIKFRSGKFFQNLGDKLIYDNFDVAVELKAKK